MSEEVVQTVKIRGAVRLLVKRCNCVIVPYLLCLLLQGIGNTVGFLTVYLCGCGDWIHSREEKRGRDRGNVIRKGRGFRECYCKAEREIERRAGKVDYRKLIIERGSMNATSLLLQREFT